MRWFMIAALLALSHTAAADLVATDIDLEVNALKLFKFGGGATITASFASGGASALGTSALGKLAAKAIGSAAAANDTATVDFVDTVSFVGSGNIEVSQNLSGTLTVTPGNPSFQAFVLAGLSLSGTGILGISTNYEKRLFGDGQSLAVRG